MRAELPIRIISSGSYLPRKVSSEEIEEKYNLSKGWSERFSGVQFRHQVTFETNGFMGAKAIEEALLKSKLTLNDIDLIISASATYDYPLPNQSSIIKSELKDGTKFHIPTIDIDTTCLSFVSAFEMAARYLDGEQYKNIIIVSSEIASKGLSSQRPETVTLFGDGAVAFVVGFDPTSQSSFIKSEFKTYSEGVSHTIIKGGGNVMFYKDHPYDENKYSFEMNGIQLLKLTKRVFPAFIESFFKQVSINFESVNFIIPHQASKFGLELVKKMYSIESNRWKSNIENYGNCIAVSIPLLLHQTIESGEIQRGDVCFLIGTSAGFSIGGVLFRY